MPAEAGFLAGSDGMDPNSEFAQPSNMMAYQAILLLFGEGWCLTVMVWFSGSENQVSKLQDSVSYGYQRGVLLTAGFGGETPELLLQEAVLLGCRRPGAFGKGATQPRVSTGWAVAPVSAGAPIVSRANASPTTEVPLRKETASCPLRSRRGSWRHYVPAPPARSAGVAIAGPGPPRESGRRCPDQSLRFALR